MEKNEYIIVISTTETKDEAKKIAQILIEKKIVACIQISGPILSLYWWEGKIEESEEWRIMAKTTNKLYDKVERCIRQNHSYSVPQIISVSISDGFAEYLKWIDDSATALFA
jgi:periplasmic divalent cation tolerance protein